MEYVTPQKVHESLESYYEVLLDRLSDMELRDEEVRETTRVVLAGSFSHLQFMFDNLLFHPLYGDFTRTKPIDMQHAFRLSCIGFFVSSYDKNNLSTMLLLDDVFNALSHIIGFNRQSATQFIRRQLASEEDTAEDESDNKEFNLSLVFYMLDLHICGYEDSKVYFTKARSEEEIETIRSRIVRTSLMGYREFYKTLSRETGADNDID